MMASDTACIKWVFQSGGRQIVQYIWLEADNKGITIGSKYADGPDILLDREDYIYLCVQFHAAEDAYYVITDFDGPFRCCPHGETFSYSTDSFTLL